MVFRPCDVTFAMTVYSPGNKHIRPKQLFEIDGHTFYCPRDFLVEAVPIPPANLFYKLNIGKKCLEKIKTSSDELLKMCRGPKKV